MKLFVDECPSPQLAQWLNETGFHEALHPLHAGRRGEPDHLVLRRCIAEQRVVVTQNARDFRGLVGREEGHPGLIVLPPAGRDQTWRLLMKAIAFLAGDGEPGWGIANHVLEVDIEGGFALYPLYRQGRDR
ncbi:MAG: DUF5615 family PIN-like protein [Acetobacterales bacterium]